MTRVLPCPSCPWRVGADPHEIPGLDLDKADALDRACPGPSSLMGPPLMACHKSSEGADWVCIGWATSDASRHSIPLRIAMADGLVPAWGDLDEARVEAGVELYATHAEMVANLREGMER